MKAGGKGCCWGMRMLWGALWGVAVWTGPVLHAQEVVSLRGQDGEQGSPHLGPEMAPNLEDFSPDGFCARKEMLRHWVMILASDRLEGRMTGSVQDSMAALLIGGEFLQNRLLPLQGAKAGRSQSDFWQTYYFGWGGRARSRNVVGVVPGTDSVLSGHYVVVGAHFDHIGWGDKTGTSMRKGERAIHNGADDNASGVAVMMELMRYFSIYPLKKTLIFAAFSGEEVGLCGSRAFLDAFPYGIHRIDAMFNLDMLGGLRGDEFRVNGVGTSMEAAGMVREAASRTDLRLTTSPGGQGPSDHAVFHAEGIPVFFFCTMPTSTYHTPDDDAHTLNYDGMVKISCVIGDLLRQVGNAEPLHPVETVEAEADTSAPRMGNIKVGLGLMPDINYSAGKGLAAMIVVEGKPAYRAGLRSGDVLLKINGKKVNTMDDYMQILSGLEKGMLVDVRAIVKKDGRKRKFKVQL